MERLINTCRQCGTPLPEGCDPQLQYCSSACRTRASRERRKGTLQPPRASIEPVHTAPEVTDEEILACVVDLASCASCLIAASNTTHPQLRWLCHNLGYGVKSLLEQEGLLDG